MYHDDTCTFILCLVKIFLFLLYISYRGTFLGQTRTGYTITQDAASLFVSLTGPGISPLLIFITSVLVPTFGRQRSEIYNEAPRPATSGGNFAPTLHLVRSYAFTFQQSTIVASAHMF